MRWGRATRSTASGHVVSGVEDQQDVRVAVLDVPGRPEPPDDLTDLRACSAVSGDHAAASVRATCPVS